MFEWLKRLTRPAPPPRETVNQKLARAYHDIRARYDAAQTTDENQRLWTMVDLLSAKSANSFQVRKTLRTRSRYEIANNSYARGITLTLANDLIGTGPRLQVRTPDKQLNKIVEDAFAAWARAVDLAEKLRTMKLAKLQDGEAFALAVTNPALESSVQLDLQLIEADQVTTPNPGYGNTNWIDGVVLDALGNIAAYNVLEMHPGDLFVPNLSPLDYRTIPRRQVLHWFRKDRPGQVRGIPELTPALDLFAQLRSFTKSTLGAARIAAAFAAVLESEAAGETEDGEAGAKADGSNAFATAEIDVGMMTELPAGFKLNQLEPAQPGTTFEMFVRMILREIARCLNVPFNIAAGDSASYNYSSGRLDHLGYHRQQRVEKSHCEINVVDRIFGWWLDEATRIPRYLPADISALASNLPHRWFWDGAESIDPVKDATARQIDLACNVTTLEEVYAEQGEEWEPRVRQRGIEIALLKELGITPEQASPTAGEPLQEEDAAA